MISRLFRSILVFFRRLWDGVSLIVVLSITATIPILQLASLGYMLESAGRVARGWPLRRCFPGARTAGLIVTSGLWLGLSWLPVWLITDLAYSAALIDPGSAPAHRWRIIARVIAVVWVVWATWALFRGGRWYHFLWPAPRQFFQTVFRRSAWHALEDRLWDFVGSLQIPRLMKIGFYGTVGAVLWLLIPSTLMVIALNGAANGSSQPGENALFGFIGLVGAIWMWYVLQYLPFLQVNMAEKGRFLAVVDRPAVRDAFRRAPWAFFIATTLFFAAAIPLYLLRIESIPSQLWIFLSLFFVLFMFPPKLLAGWALRCSHRRQRPVFWLWRWVAWVPLFAAIGVYVGVLYIAKFALWEGAASVLLQHAFLPPVPFYLR
ncbi:MAG: DUF4013 domain-containing protein [Planctomycetota bacterium]|jgi:hypothetical protein